MLTAPVQSAQEVASNTTFEALLWSLSRPGLSRTVSEPSDVAIIDALIDRECRVYSADPILMQQIMRSGAQVAEIADADHVFLAALKDLTTMEEIARGSDLYPDGGATVVLRVDLDHGPRVLLSGPGVDDVLEVQIGGLPVGFWQRRTELIRYPMGFDLFLRDGSRVIGIPRSTKVEVL